MKLVVLSMFFALHAAAAVPKSTCFPNTKEAESWPVCVIYLHGILEPTGKGFGTDWEKKNRAQFTRMTSELSRFKCRIAAPVSPIIRQYGFGRVYAWSQASQSTVKANFDRIHKAAISDACPGASMTEKSRVVLGFSNGANATAQFGDLDCKELKGYHLLAFGADGDRRKGKCGSLINNAPHTMPSDGDLLKILSEILVGVN